MAPQQRRSRTGRLAFIAATVAASAALASGPGFAAGAEVARATDPPAPVTTAPGTTAPVTPAVVEPVKNPEVVKTPEAAKTPEPKEAPAFGAFLDSGARGWPGWRR